MWHAVIVSMSINVVECPQNYLVPVIPYITTIVNSYALFSFGVSFEKFSIPCRYISSTIEVPVIELLL